MEIESIQKMLAKAADTGHSNWDNAKGSTSFWMREVWCWFCLFGNKIPISVACQLSSVNLGESCLVITYSVEFDPIIISQRASINFRAICGANLAT